MGSVITVQGPWVCHVVPRLQTEKPIPWFPRMAAPLSTSDFFKEALIEGPYTMITDLKRPSCPLLFTNQGNLGNCLLSIRVRKDRRGSRFQPDVLCVWSPPLGGASPPEGSNNLVCNLVFAAAANDSNDEREETVHEYNHR